MSGLQAEPDAAGADCGAPAASDQENADPAEEGSLRKMFVQGSHGIATHRCAESGVGLEQFGISCLLRLEASRRQQARAFLKCRWRLGRWRLAVTRQYPAQAPATSVLCRTDNLFQSLEQRTLTGEEQRIIEQRVRCC